MPLSHLDNHEKSENATERPEIVQVPRRREIIELIVHHPHDGKPVIEPFLNSRARLVSLMRVP